MQYGQYPCLSKAPKAEQAAKTRRVGIERGLLEQLLRVCKRRRLSGGKWRPTWCGPRTETDRHRMNPSQEYVPMLRRTRITQLWRPDYVPAPRYCALDGARQLPLPANRRRLALLLPCRCHCHPHACPARHAPCCRLLLCLRKTGLLSPSPLCRWLPPQHHLPPRPLAPQSRGRRAKGSRSPSCCRCQTCAATGRGGGRSMGGKLAVQWHRNAHMPSHTPSPSPSVMH